MCWERIVPKKYAQSEFYFIIRFIVKSDEKFVGVKFYVHEFYKLSRRVEMYLLFQRMQYFNLKF